MGSASFFEVVRPYDRELTDVASAHGDPAVGATMEYASTRDLDALVSSCGGAFAEAKPVRFRCRALSRSQRNRLREISTEGLQRIQAFRFGCVEILDIPDGSGGRKAWTPDREGEAGPIKEQALDKLESMGFGDIDFEDVGSAIIARSFLAQGTSPQSVLLPSSRHALAVNLATSHVERERATSTDQESSCNSAENKSGAEAPPTTAP